MFRRILLLILCCSLVMLSACGPSNEQITVQNTVPPTVTDPTEVSTDPSTEIPTEAPAESQPDSVPTEPPEETPLPAESIDAELYWVATLERGFPRNTPYKGTPPYKVIRHSYGEIVDTINALDAVEDYVPSPPNQPETTDFGIDPAEDAPVYLWEGDYSQFDEAFFENNSIVVIPFYDRLQGIHDTDLISVERDENGVYQVLIHTQFITNAAWERTYCFIFLLVLKGVTDDAEVNVTVLNRMVDSPSLIHWESETVVPEPGDDYSSTYD